MILHPLLFLPDERMFHIKSNTINISESKPRLFHSQNRYNWKSYEVKQADVLTVWKLFNHIFIITI